MVDLYEKICEESECLTQGSYCFENDNKKKFCVKHKKDDMINIKRKYKNCKVKDCTNIAKFNKQGVKGGKYCEDHKEKDMENVVDKKCKHAGCNTVPHYGSENGKRTGVYCKKHIPEGISDIVVTTKLCKTKDCKKQPSYGYEDDKKPTYCYDHKLDKMTNIRDNKCLYEKCNILAVFANKGDKKAFWCNKHKKEEMVNIRNKRCIYEGCEINANYNYEDKKSGIYCVTHKLDEMIDVKHPRCKTYLCYTRPIDNYEGYCNFCYSNIYPDRVVSKNFKTKENIVMDFVKKEFKEYKMIFDKTINGGCSKKRPDCFIDTDNNDTNVIFIENDENQHKSYDTTCENKKIMELSQDINHRNAVFIRFNPDSYKTKEGTIKSCFELDTRTGLCYISNDDELNKRLKVLKETIEYWLINKSDKMIKIIKLFYNEI